MKGHRVRISEGELTALVKMTGPNRKVVKTNWGMDPVVFIEGPDDLWMVRALRSLRPVRQAPVKHHFRAMRARGSAWGDCSCGWQSGQFTTVSGAHYAFGEHLLDALGPEVADAPVVDLT
jgi:hypothetical protein